MNILSLEWLNTAGDLFVWSVIWVCCLLWLYQGGHALATRSFVRLVAVRTFLGGAVCLGLGGMNYWVHHSMDRLAVLTNSTPHLTNQLPENWGANNAPAEREKGSRILASTAYVDSSQLFKYVDMAGVWKEYCPTTEDAQRIRERTEAVVRTSLLSKESHDSAVRTWIAGIVALLLGLAVGRSKGANQSFQGTLRNEAAQRP